MATQEATTGVEERMDKKVTLVGYTGETEMDIREWLTENFEEDYTAQRIDKSYSHYLLFDDVELEVNEDEFNAIQAKEPEGVGFSVEEEEKTNHVHSTYKAASEIRAQMGKNNPSVDLGDIGEWVREYKATRDGTYSTDMVVRFGRSIEYTDMLVHPSEMTVDNVVDGSEPAQIAFKFDVKYKQVTADEMDALDDKVLEPMIDFLSTHELIERVRWTDCEKQTVEQMVCFDI
jgi:hypothetical protein